MFGNSVGFLELTARLPARMRRRHPTQSKNFIFFLLFKHLAESQLMRSDMGQLEPATVVVTGSRTFATIGERDCLAMSQREAPSVQHTDERHRAAMLARSPVLVGRPSRNFNNG
jgi:hypothetical protein